MDTSNEVRVVAGCAWDDDADFVRFLHGEPHFDSDRPALLVIDSGLTAEQMRTILAFQRVLDIVADNDPGITDTGGTDGQG